jgi:hypothetical protein
MTSTRRSFLHTLGIAASGIAFAPLAKFESLLLPDHIVEYDGEPNLRWMLAESVALLAAELPSDQFRANPPTRKIDGLMEGMYQFGLDMSLPDDWLSKYSKDQMRAYYLKPAMQQFAQEIRFRKAKLCYPLMLLDAVEHCANISAPKHGLNLRFVRAWNQIGNPIAKRDPVNGEPLHDENGDLVIEGYGPPRFVNRFDMLVA